MTWLIRPAEQFMAAWLKLKQTQQQPFVYHNIVILFIVPCAARVTKGTSSPFVISLRQWRPYFFSVAAATNSIDQDTQLDVALSSYLGSSAFKESLQVMHIPSPTIAPTHDCLVPCGNFFNFLWLGHSSSQYCGSFTSVTADLLNHHFTIFPWPDGLLFSNHP